MTCNHTHVIVASNIYILGLLIKLLHFMKGRQKSFFLLLYNKVGLFSLFFWQLCVAFTLIVVITASVTFNLRFITMPFSFPIKIILSFMNLELSSFLPSLSLRTPLP